MKKQFLPILFITAVAISCNVRTKDRLADDSGKQYDMLLKDTTSAIIIDTTYNFGKVTDGEKVEYNFRFVNSGKKPLIVTNATASCGCTVPQKPEQPINPGDTGFIRVVFDSKGRVGSAHKTINVVSNARPVFPTLLLTGEVVGKE